MVFKGSSVRSSTFVEKPSNAILIKTISCPVLLLLSTDLSHWILNHLHRARSRSNWSAKFADNADTLLTIVDTPS